MSSQPSTSAKGVPSSSSTVSSDDDGLAQASYKSNADAHSKGPDEHSSTHPETGLLPVNRESAKAMGPSNKELTHRRAHLRAKRRHKFFKTAWRAFAMTGFAASTVWLATSPVWLIKSSEQLEINDNHLLTDDNIRDLMPVSYPQSLLRVKPDSLANSLETYAPIKSATVSRRLVPPRLHVRVVERRPVAVAVPDTTQPLEAIPSQPVPFSEPGLLDAEGYWMPRNSFHDLGGAVSLPTLVVKGMRAGNEAQWKTLFQGISRSPVDITEIDWTEPSNLILQTEIGSVHLGPYGKKFEAQMVALDQMRSLGKKVNPETVAFINLHDPDNPVIEILQAASNP